MGKANFGLENTLETFTCSDMALFCSHYSVLKNHVNVSNYLITRWSHEYQDATIEKIIRFLQGRSSRDSSVGSESLDGTPPLGEK